MELAQTQVGMGKWVKGCLADTNLDDDHNTTSVVDVVWTVTGMLRRGYYVPRGLEIHTQAVGTSYYFIEDGL